MDSDYSYQAKYIWKQTTYDGLLPITNFTEEIKEDEVRKRGKDKDKGKELGQITEFNTHSDQGKQKSFSNNTYIYLANKNKYGLIKSKKGDDTLILKVRSSDKSNETEDLEVKIGEHEILNEVEVSVRVVMSEDKRFSLIIKKASNDKIKTVAEELAELLGVSKYSLTFFFKGDKVSFGERLGDRNIGGKPNNDNDDFLLCLKGGNEGPKVWKRFTHVDDPCRQLSYISDEEAFDAIQFVPKKDILFTGFSVYIVASTDIDFKVIYKYKIGSESVSEQVAEFSQADCENKMADIMLDSEIPVSANKPITILVRFQAGDEYFCSTLLGYGGENYLTITDNGEDKELFEVRETADCTKGETDLRFGQIPRLFYFPV